MVELELVEHLKRIRTDHSNVEISFMAGVDAEFARRLAAVFEAAGWRTNFNNVAIESYHRTYRVYGTMVSGVNPVIVDTVIDALAQGGIDAKRQIDTTQIPTGNPKWPGVQARVNIVIGYKDSENRFQEPPKLTEVKGRNSVTEGDLLFRSAELGEVLEDLARKALAKIASLTADQVHKESEPDLIGHLKYDFVVNPLRLNRDKMFLRGPHEVDIELRGENAFLYGSDHVRVKGIEVTFVVPFEGDSWLFKLKPNSWTTVFPRGEIVGQELRITMQSHDPNVNQMAQARDWRLQNVEDYIRRQQDQINAYNKRIETAITNAIEKRREQLAAIDVFGRGFGIPKQEDLEAETHLPRPRPAGKTSERSPRLREARSQPKVFICYAKDDYGKALEVYECLERAGATPWLDKKSLVPGDIWKPEIERAVGAADAFVACLRKGFEEIGFRQQEVRWAIEALQLRPPGRGFIIPFLLEPCALPDWCKPIHAGDTARPTTMEELLVAIEKHCNWKRKP